MATTPSPDDLIAYHEGWLTPAECERVEAALGAFPEAARALRDMAAFPAVEPASPADRLSREEVAARWQTFRRRLAETQDSFEAGEEEPIETAHPVLARDREAARWWTGRRSLRWALPVAAALAMIVLGVALWRSTLSAPQPAVNVAAVTLSPLPPPGERAGGWEARVPLAEARNGLLVRLDIAEVEPFSEYRLAIVGAGSEVAPRAEGLRRRPDDTLTAFLPRGFLTVGRYRFELTGISSAGAEPLAVYGLEVTP